VDRCLHLRRVNMLIAVFSTSAVFIDQIEKSRQRKK